MNQNNKFFNLMINKPLIVSAAVITTTIAIWFGMIYGIVRIVKWAWGSA